MGRKKYNVPLELTKHQRVTLEYRNRRPRTQEFHSVKGAEGAISQLQINKREKRSIGE